MYRNSYVEINLDKIKYNAEYFIHKTNKKIIGVVKANGYGSVDYMEISALKKAGVDFFAVSSLDEALNLRKHNIEDEILILGYVGESGLDIVRNNGFGIVTVNLDYVKRNDLNNIKVHIKIDTGMNRIGVEIDQVNETIEVLKNKGALIEGIMTHLSSADVDKDYTVGQYEKFKKCVEESNYPFKYIHISATDGALILDDTICTHQRIGIGLLGYSSYKTKLKPAVSLYSDVIMCKKLEKGETVSYGRHYTSDGNGYILTIPIGYADGIDRKNTGKKVYVENEYGTIVGSVCMDQMMILTDNPHDVDTPVEIYGEHINVDDRAKELDTISYELLTGLSDRLKRIYIENGEIINSIDPRF